MIGAEDIKERLSMRDVAERYGFELDRKSCIRCPFHNDNHPSLRIYDEPGKGFYCFSCGTGGSVIDFVMRLFGITFKQAVIRISSDFGYGAETTDSETVRNRKEERRKRQRKKEKLEQRINDLAAEHCRLWQAINKSQPMSDRWCEAVHRIDQINYKMEVLECQKNT